MPQSQGLSLADRIDIVLCTLRPFPDTAQGEERERFGRLVENLGVKTVYDYMRARRIVNAGVVVHSGHEAVADLASPFQIFQRVGLAAREIQRRGIPPLAEAFADAGTPVIAFKGVALDASLGNTTAPSLSNDIDLIVRRDCVSEARKALESLGYERDLVLDNGRIRRMPLRVSQLTEESIYSFGQCSPYAKLFPVPELDHLSDQLLTLLPHLFCMRSGELVYKLSVDLHYSLNHLADDIGTRVKPSEDVWWGDTQSVDIDGVEITTLSDRVMSWVLLHRLYVDSVLFNDRSLKALCHLKLLRRHGRFDVDHVFETARRYPYLAPSLHHALRATTQICGLNEDSRLTSESVHATTAPLMNAGDCLPALLDMGVEFRLIDLTEHQDTAARIGFRAF
jgi:hypothetical protein